MALKKTRLHAWHTEAGARMAAFGGYDMPLWYPAEIKAEHLAVIGSAGLFDTSHMALLAVSGADAYRLLQRCFTRDLDRCGSNGTPIRAGQCAYGVFLDDTGCVLDDALVYRTGETTFMVVVNAGMGASIAAHLRTQFPSSNAIVTDYSDRMGKMDLQGPLAAKILQKLLKEPETVLAKFPYFSFKGHLPFIDSELEATRLVDRTPILLSRTGYTGEFGFELFVDADALETVWQQVLAVGEDFDLLPCGLAARDALRTGAVLPLSHQDIGPWPFVRHPWSFALPYGPAGQGFTKAFLGDDALLRAEATADTTYPFVGFDPRKVVARPQSRVDLDGASIGRVLTCVTDMAMDRREDKVLSMSSPDRPDGFSPRGLSCGFVKLREPLEVGRHVELTDGRRTIRAEIVRDIRPGRSARNPIQQML